MKASARPVPGDSTFLGWICPVCKIGPIYVARKDVPAEGSRLPCPASHWIDVAPEPKSDES